MTFFALTLSLILSFQQGSDAATIGPKPDVNRPHDEVVEVPAKEPVILKQLNVTEPPDSKKKEQGSFYKYDGEFSVHLGPYFLFTAAGRFVTYGNYGLSFLWPSLTGFHVETGADAIASGESHIWVQGRWIQKSTEAFRPYVSAGIGFKVLQQDNLGAALALINRYFIQGNGGFEWSLSGGLSERTQLFVGIDSSWAVFVGATAGLTLGF